jgi:hypothetical protein
MYVIFREPGSALTPSPRERDTHRVEDGSLSGIVLADEDGRITQLDIQISNRTEVFYIEPGYAHRLLPHPILPDACALGQQAHCRHREYLAIGRLKQAAHVFAPDLEARRRARARAIHWRYDSVMVDYRRAYAMFARPAKRSERFV